MAKRTLMFRECARCGEDDDNITGATTTLIGSYHTQLCMVCRNAFDVYMRGQPTYIRLEYLNDAISMASVRTAADGVDRLEDVTGLRRQIREVNTELHELSRAFVEDYEDYKDD